MNYAITTAGLTKHFGRIQAVNDLNLEVPHGAIYGILGPNGAGKTTTLRMIAGLCRPTSGSATVNGAPVTLSGQQCRQLGYLAQEPKFYGWMTGRQVLRYVARFFGPVDNAHINQLLERAGLSEVADRKSKTYSLGMQQRLGIAQALAGRPKLLMLDEPVSALDPLGRAEVLTMMLELKGETTIFFSTHILEDAQRCCDAIAILDKGRLVKAAPTAELLASFTKSRLRVMIAGAAESVEAQLTALPGVTEAKLVGREGDTSTFDFTMEDGRAREVQRAVTKYAAERGLALLECDNQCMNLEAVFLKLIGKGR